MERVLVLLLGLAVAQRAQAADTLEGPNIQPGAPSLATTFINCHSDPVGSKVFVFQRPPVVAGGIGYVGIAHCQYLSDPQDVLFPYLAPDGYWLVATNTCDPDMRCLCTRWQYAAQSGGGDCGEDPEHLAVCTPNQPDSCPSTSTTLPPTSWLSPLAAYAAPTSEPRVHMVGKCRVVKGEVQWWHCNWKAPRGLP